MQICVFARKLSAVHYGGISLKPPFNKTRKRASQSKHERKIQNYYLKQTCSKDLLAVLNKAQAHRLEWLAAFVRIRWSSLLTLSSGFRNRLLRIPLMG